MVFNSRSNDKNVSAENTTNFKFTSQSQSSVVFCCSLEIESPIIKEIMANVFSPVIAFVGKVHKHHNQPPLILKFSANNE